MSAASLPFEDRLVLAQTEVAMAYQREQGVRLSTMIDIAERHSVEASCFDGVRGRSDFHRMTDALYVWAREASDEELQKRASL